MFTALLYKASLDYLVLEVGIGASVLEHSFHELGLLAMNSLIKSSWVFMYDSDIKLCHNIVVPSFLA